MTAKGRLQVGHPRNADHEGKILPRQTRGIETPVQAPLNCTFSNTSVGVSSAA